jgi:hypothetical protein
MSPVLLVLVASLLLTGWGCRTLPESGDVPARIVRPTPEGRAELDRVVSEALHGATVTLADDALTDVSWLTIERRRPRDIEGRHMGGREMGRPTQFRLFTNNSRCVLVQQPDGPRWELTNSTCVPE